MSAMVQSIDNLTALTIRLRSVTPHPRLHGWDLATVDVLATAPVPGHADLLSPNLGPLLDVAVRHDRLSGVPAGSTIRLRAKLATGEVIAEPHPSASDFVVQPP